MFATRLLAVALLRSARPALQTTYQHHLPRYQRSFSASSTSRSSPKPSTPDSLTEFNEELQRSSLWKKLAGHPEAIAAIRDFGRLIQMSGIDLRAGKPSAFAWMKLASNSEFRASIARVKEQMGNAGVDLSSPDMLQEVMRLQKALAPKH